MKCKNCQLTLTTDSQYCNHCGGEIITEKITLPKLIRNGFTETFGWDASYLRTFRAMIIEPEKVISSYLNGVRKRYMNPFKFMFLGAAISTIIFGLFADKFSEYTLSSSNIFNEWLYKLMGMDDESIALSKQSSANMSKQMLKYLNLIYLINLPIYALMSRFSFPKRLNYGEHLVVNGFIQGFTFTLSILFFILALITKQNFVYNVSLIFVMAYYTYVFLRLFKLSLPQSLIAIFRFFISILLFFIALFILGILLVFIGYAIGFLIEKTGKLFV